MATMQLFQTIKDSIYNPQFYQVLLATPVRSSIKFYFKLAAILSLITAILSIPALLVLAKAETYQKIVNTFPQELAVTVANGKASTNVTEPYYIKNTTGEGPENIIVLDTKTDFSVGQFDQYKSAAILKSDSLAVRDESGKVQLIPLNNMGSFTVDRAMVQTWANKVQSWAKFIIPFLLVCIMVGLMIVHSFRLVYLFIAALVVWLIATLFKKKITYMKAYQIGLHAMVLPMLIQVLLSPFHWYFPLFTFSLVVFIIAAINIRGITTTPVEQTPTVVEN
jgi:hypothetical protein